MMIRIGINGFGRIGRLVCRIALDHCNVQIVAINSTVAPEYMAYLFKHDSIHGQFNGTITYTETHLIINGMPILVHRERDPTKIPWRDSGAIYIIEATGQFTTLEQASAHLQGGASKVIITSPSVDAPMIVMGVNTNDYHPKMQIISNASCTTNCVAPLLKILQDEFGIEDASITTIHAITASQNIVDGNSSRDWRGGRSGFNNIIPTSTGAMKALGKIIPELQDKVTGMAFRVPIVDVSVADCTIRVCTPITFDIFSRLIQESANDIIDYTFEPVVSTDFIGNPHSCTVDLQSSSVMNSHLIKIVAFYDNEWGFSNRVVDLIEYIHSRDNVLPLGVLPSD